MPEVALLQVTWRIIRNEGRGHGDHHGIEAAAPIVVDGPALKGSVVEGYKGRSYFTAPKDISKTTSHQL